MSYMINNNALEVDPSPRKKRKRTLQCTNAYMNPALDILSTEDTMCNNLMEVLPAKRSRRSRSCDSRATFENQALDLPNRDFNGLLRKELANVNDKLLSSITESSSPTYRNFNDSLNMIVEEKSILHARHNDSCKQVNSTPLFQGNTVIKRRASFDLSFIEKLGIDDSVNGEALYLDDDLNESNIMEIKTITKDIIKNVKRNTNPFIDYDGSKETSLEQPISNFPFGISVKIYEANDEGSVGACDATEPEIESITSIDEVVVPRRLFTDDDSIQYIDDQSIVGSNKLFVHSTINEPLNCNFAAVPGQDNHVFIFEGMNKQSKILGCDVSNLSQHDIYNCEKPTLNNVTIAKLNNNIEATFKDNSNRVDCAKKCSKSNNKISSKIFNKIKDVFKHEKKGLQKNESVHGNPYEVVRKAPVQEKSKKPLPVCFVNPALNLNAIDSEYGDQDTCETVSASVFKIHNPFEITPIKRAKERFHIKENLYASHNSALSNCVDLSDLCQSENAGKKQVRFDCTLNHEKLITGNSFDSSHHSGSSSSHVTQVFHQIDTQIDEFHNELENCFNEKKFIAQNI